MGCTTISMDQEIMAKLQRWSRIYDGHGLSRMTMCLKLGGFTKITEKSLFHFITARRTDFKDRKLWCYLINCEYLKLSWCRVRPAKTKPRLRGIQRAGVGLKGLIGSVATLAV
jgi:hypothetical protein